MIQRLQPEQDLKSNNVDVCEGVDGSGRVEKEWLNITESILFLNHLTAYSPSSHRLTDADVRAEDKEGDDNLNETDYVVKRDMDGE